MGDLRYLKIKGDCWGLGLDFRVIPKLFRNVVAATAGVEGGSAAGVGGRSV